MKKVYSSKLKAEVFALAPEQLKIFEQAGYKTPDAAEVIADAGAATIEPPASARAYAVFNLKSGAFSVRVRGCTVKGSETGAFVGEVVQASIMKDIAVLVARGVITSSVMGISGQCRAKISLTSKGEIKVERSEARSLQLST